MAAILESINNFDKSKKEEEVNDRSIICFQHGCCTASASHPERHIFCFTFPPTCPACGEDLQGPNSDLIIPPFRLPNPFNCKSSSSTRRRGRGRCGKLLGCALLIRPAEGTFFGSSTSSSSSSPSSTADRIQDLHIAVTDSTSTKIVEYDQCGLLVTPNQYQTCSSSTVWKECIQIEILQAKNRTDTSMEVIWDETLCRLTSSTSLESVKTTDQEGGPEFWSAARYSPTGLNCFSFVMHFLGSLPVSCLDHLTTFSSSPSQSSLQQVLSSKEAFCEQFLIPAMKPFTRYLSVWRQVCQSTDGICIVSKDHQTVKT